MYGKNTGNRKRVPLLFIGEEGQGEIERGREEPLNSTANDGERKIRRKAEEKTTTR